MSAIFSILAVFALVHFARTVFGERGRDLTSLLWAAAGVVFTSVLTAVAGHHGHEFLPRLLFQGWPVHPAAGMLLGLLFPLAFSSKGSPWPMLGGLICAAVFAFFGAAWVLIPAGIAAGLWLVAGTGFQALGSLLTGQTTGTNYPRPTGAHGQLPEQAGGLPMVGTAGAAQPEAVPVGAGSVGAGGTAQARAAAPAPSTAPGDALSALHAESRLPADARAQLVVLDSLTAETLASLHAQGLQGTEAEYQSRSIRREYAPNVVQAYLKLPPTLADVTPIDGPKTGRDLLTEQLDLLIAAARDLLTRSAQSSGQDLLTQGRFLREKFAPKKSDLEL